MPTFCVVVGCANRGNRDNVRFFRIPAILNGRLQALSRERRFCWVKSLKRGDLSDSYIKYARICSKHFLGGAPAPLVDTESPDWIPTQYMGHNSCKTKGKQLVDVSQQRMSQLLDTQVLVKDEPPTDLEYVKNEAEIKDEPPHLGYHFLLERKEVGLDFDTPDLVKIDDLKDEILSDENNETEDVKEDVKIKLEEPDFTYDGVSF